MLEKIYSCIGKYIKIFEKKLLFKSILIEEGEDGGWVGRSWIHLLLPPTQIFGWSSHEYWTINRILANRKFWSQGVQKSPCTIQIASTTSNEEALQNSQARLKKLPAGSIPTGKEREMPREPFWTFLSQDKMHWFFGPYFTETSWAECRNWCSKGNSGPPRALALTQNCHQHQAGKSWPSYTD